MTAQENPVPASEPMRVADLSTRKPISFEIAPDADTRAAIAGYLGIDAVRKLTFAGTLRAEGRRDWLLRGELGATVVQRCVVTLKPVHTRIDESVTRRYLADMPEPDQQETEIPEDETVDPLGPVIDPAAVMIEALALALPPFPRAEGAELGEAVFTEPGKAPMRDEDARPFAGLGALRDKLARGDD